MVLFVRNRRTRVVGCFPRWPESFNVDGGVAAVCGDYWRGKIYLKNCT